MVNLSALRISQFGRTFYQTAIKASDLERLVRFEVLSYGQERVSRGSGAKRAKEAPRVNWNLLEEIIHRSAEAFQRPIIGKKIEKLVQFYEERREHRDLPAIPGAVLLVSEERLNFVPKEEELGTLRIPEEKPILITLDGQHRLLALHMFAQGLNHDIQSLQVPAVIFDALRPAESVEMFVTINTEQTRLKKDLVIALSGKKLYPNEKDKSAALAHDVLRKLNEREDSPLRGEIRILGVGPGKVASAPLATEMAQFFHAQAGWRGADAFYENAQKFFLNYFKQIAKTFPVAWTGRKYSIKSSLALRAFIRVAQEVFSKLRQRKADAGDAREIGETLKPWAERIGDARFETNGAWRTQAGPGAVERLAQDLREALLD